MSRSVGDMVSDVLVLLLARGSDEDAFGGQGFYDLDDAQKWIASMPRSKYTVLPPI